MGARDASYNRHVFTRKRGGQASAEALRAAVAFRKVLRSVEEAKETLLLGVPSGRAARMPLAESLAAFEQGLREARAGMDSWRIPDVETEWVACDRALGRSAERAERFRLEAPTEAYEEVVSHLDEILDPLDAFAAAARRLRRLGA